MADYLFFCESHFQEMGVRSGFSPYVMQHVGSRITPHPSRKCSVDTCYYQAAWMLPETINVELIVCQRCKGQCLKGDRFCPTCGARFDEKQHIDLGTLQMGQDGAQKVIDIAVGVLEREKICRYCGAKSMGKLECPRCGAPLR